ncbi:MAG TPA: peptidase domain-containing ABC transporter [Candidatus Dormibacteraeota bacterium]|nr:peptidase domain-containing ABC transporter [Candidatus Dormibacteraeota bacterium]
MRRRIPHVRQMERSDCGAACLAMVLAHHGCNVPLTEVRAVIGGGRGVHARAILDAAGCFGLRGRGVKAEVEQLAMLPRGSILHWRFNHFLVLDRVRRRGIDVLDPASGPRRIPMALVRRYYTGVALLLEPTEDLVPTPRRRAGSLWRYVRPLLAQRVDMGWMLLTSALIRVLAMAVPLFTAVLVDRVLPTGDRRLLVVLALALLVVVGYDFLTDLTRSFVLLRLRTVLQVEVTRGFLDHLVELPYRFFVNRSAGDLLMRMESTSVVREMLTTGALSSVLDAAMVSLYLVLLVVLSPPIAALVVVLAVLEAAVVVVSWRRSRRLMSESLEATARMRSYQYELLAGMESLKAAGAEHRAVEHWADLFIHQVNVSRRRGRLGAVVGAIMGALDSGSPLLVLVVGAVSVENGHFSLGTMLGVVALANGFLRPISSLAGTGIRLQAVGSYMERISDVLDTPQESEGRTLTAASGLRGHIVASHVTFRYTPLAIPAVDDVSVTVEPGRYVAIVGRSGSGKSTLANLLLGLANPTAGTVTLDGDDLALLDPRSVRGQVGIVTQHAYLFGTSIRENITLAKPGATLDEVIAAARLACIHGDVDAMPMRYETVLADRGASLSGGQRQRIALARALVRQPSLLLLDEATSALDTATEREIHANLAALHCTTIAVAHRLSTVAHADLILVMDGGRVVERGTHEELMALDGLYRRQVELQTETLSRPPEVRLTGTRARVSRRRPGRGGAGGTGARAG